jgi:acyl-CoA reductase-like NAD-dependent aldehyde dehydrogenase
MTRSSDPLPPSRPSPMKEDVIRRANDTEYGLVAYVFSEA